MKQIQALIDKVVFRYSTHYQVYFRNGVLRITKDGIDAFISKSKIDNLIQRLVKAENENDLWTAFVRVEPKNQKALNHKFWKPQDEA